MKAENPDETGSRTNSFQRKKPPWLKLDIPTIQLTPDEPPQAAAPHVGSRVAAVRRSNEAQDKNEFQPVKRVRSVSMPGENPHTHSAAMETSNGYLKPPVEKMAVMQSIKRGTADWFGASKDGDGGQRWRRRSLQHCSQLFGGLKAQVTLLSLDSLSLSSTDPHPDPDPTPRLSPRHHRYGMQRVGLLLAASCSGRRKNLEKDSLFSPFVSSFLIIFSVLGVKTFRLKKLQVQMTRRFPFFIFQ
uniref:Inactive rhomboid protein n=1 Tax=Poecilia mexicana TaxID=48701 RepID=A0A3B3XQV2_9TELE